MYFVLGGLSVLFILIGYTVSEQNAQYILSGYNTLSEEERRKFNLSSYIPYFRRFHVFLGVSFFLLGLLVHFLIDENATGMFIGVYPILTYLYFILASQKYAQQTQIKQNRIASIIGFVALAFVIGVFRIHYKESEILINRGSIRLTGAYGEDLAFSQIKSIALNNDLPAITIRTNGFAAGTVKKGYFRTKDGKIIKLILNTTTRPYIQITKKTGEQIYYSAKKKSNEQIFKNLQTNMPQVVNRSTGN